MLMNYQQGYKWVRLSLKDKLAISFTFSIYLFSEPAILPLRIFLTDMLTHMYQKYICCSFFMGSPKKNKQKKNKKLKHLSIG